MKTVTPVVHHLRTRAGLVGPKSV